MYFPGSALEAMVIKRISQTSQLLVKCVSNEKLKNNGTMTFYWQRDTGRLSQEYIFSTNEALFGFRCLYNFSQGAERLNTALYNNSSLSLGTELWYGAANMSPGVSTALRYSTQSTYTGKPLTMTLACNPLLGHISSTYSVKTSINSTFSSRYDFNIYSYDSDLSFGCEFWKSSGRMSMLPLKRIDSSLKPHSKHSVNDQTVIEAFESLVKDTDYSSVVKISTSLNNRDFKFMWEGKFSDFLLAAGAELQLESNVPQVKKCGIQIQYSS
jgi:distribution and morphology protein 10